MTGGSGVVGRPLVESLVAGGHRVRALARSGESRRALLAMGAEPVPGDMCDSPSLGELVRGCRWVFNVAGVNELCPADPDRMWRVNVGGPRRLVQACEEAGVERIVHTSSVTAIGTGDGLRDEESPHPGHHVSLYARTKFEAELALLSHRGPVEVVAVNPSSVQGPGRASGSGRLLLAAARGRLPLAIDASFSLVDARDCAAGHLLAAERGAPGRRYVLSAGHFGVRELLRAVSAAAGARSRPWVVAGGTARALSWLGAVPGLCAETVRVLAAEHRYDGSRAERELGLVYRSLEETLTDTLAWFEGEGLL